MSAADKHSQGGEQWITGGGSSTVAVAADSQSVVIKAKQGRLCKVLVTSTGTGTGNATFYDNPSTNSGTVIGLVPADAAAGNVYTFEMPASTGIYCVNPADGPAMTVSIY